MPAKNQTIKINTKQGGSFDCYLACPDTETALGPAVVIMSSIFGDVPAPNNVTPNPSISMDRSMERSMEEASIQNFAQRSAGKKGKMHQNFHEIPRLHFAV